MLLKKTLLSFLYLMILSTPKVYAANSSASVGVSLQIPPWCRVESITEISTGTYALDYQCNYKGNASISVDVPIGISQSLDCTDAQSTSIIPTNHGISTVYVCYVESSISSLRIDLQAL